jgi:hypothetical protein
LFVPFGLRQTNYCDVAPLIKHRAHGYDLQGSSFRNSEFLSMDQPFAAGSLCSTVGDLVAWTRALASGKVVSPASYARMTTPAILTSGRPMTYGYGLAADTFAGHRLISHGGGINGFAAQLDYYPDDTLIVAVLGNASAAPSSDIARAIARAILGVVAPPPQAPKDIALSANDRRKYVGTYRLVQQDGSTRNVAITEEGEQVFAQLGAAGRTRLTYQGDNVFLTAPGNARVQFDLTGGKAVGFVYGAGMRQREATRVP